MVRWRSDDGAGSTANRAHGVGGIFEAMPEMLSPDRSRDAPKCRGGAARPGWGCATAGANRRASRPQNPLMPRRASPVQCRAWTGRPDTLRRRRRWLRLTSEPAVRCCRPAVPRHRYRRDQILQPCHQRYATGVCAGRPTLRARRDPGVRDHRGGPHSRKAVVCVILAAPKALAPTRGQ